MGVKDIWAKGALAEELDALSLNMAGVSDKIGETTETGGTDSSGSLMAKANAILDGKATRSYGGTKNFSLVGFNFTKLSTNMSNVAKASGSGLLSISFYGNVTSVVSLSITIDGKTNSFSGAAISSGSDGMKYEFEFSKEISVGAQNTSTTTSAALVGHYSIQYR